MSYYAQYVVIDTSFGEVNLGGAYDSYEEAEEYAKEACQSYTIVQIDMPI